MALDLQDAMISLVALARIFLPYAHTMSKAGGSRMTKRPNDISVHGGALDAVAYGDRRIPSRSAVHLTEC